MDKRKRFEKILKDIRQVKIQGAKNIANAALKAYELFPTNNSKKKLLSLRPTEPMLQNVLKRVDKELHENIIKHFDLSQNKINNYVLKTINKNDLIFTHCHSSTVVEALLYADKKGKNLEVYNTETRPLFQGKKTAKELREAGIKTTMFVDSAIGVALSNEQGTKKPNKVFIGADALLKKGIVNKIGSELVCRVAKENKIPVYVLADSWKFSKKKVKMEQRPISEIWASTHRSINFNIHNPAFEFVPKKYITKVVTELGVMTYSSFLNAVSSDES